MGVAVSADAMLPFSVKDVCIAFVERKFASCCRQEVVVELDVCLGLGVYRFMLGNW